MSSTKWILLLLLLFVATKREAAAQAAAGANTKPDVLIFSDGEKLIGHIVSATTASVIFKSDMAGQITADWSKIQELQSSATYAVIPKGTKLRKSEDAKVVPQGPIALEDQKVQVTPAAPAQPQTIPVPNVGNVVTEAEFQRAFERTGFFHGWTGPAAGGIALTESTQKTRTYTASLNLVRPVPAETWADLRSRTTFDLDEAYTSTSEPATPRVKTSLFHAGVEQDWYVKPRLFLFVGATFDHSFSQGLVLQQNYGGGVGFVVFKNAKQEFDVKASVNYIRQEYQISSFDKNLIGSVFGETYTYKFDHGIQFSEQGSYTAAWNDTKAYTAFGSASLTLPVYHRFGFSIGAVDTFLNEPPPAFKRNSFQFTVGASYSFE